MTKRERELYNRMMLAIAALGGVLIALVVINADAIDGVATCPIPADQGQRVVIYAVPDGMGGLKDEVHYQPVGFGGSHETYTK